MTSGAGGDLDRSSTPLELRAHAVVIGAEQRVDVLGIHRLRARGEPYEVAEDDRDDLPLAPRRFARHGAKDYGVSAE